MILAVGGRTFRPQHHERQGKKKLAQHQPAHVPLHLGFGPPQAHGFFIGALQPHAVDEEIRDPDSDEHGNDSEDETFGIHAGRMQHLATDASADSPYVV